MEKCFKKVLTLWLKMISSRRGVSYLNLEEFDLSERDLVAAHKKFPTNRAVNEKLGQVKQRRKAAGAEVKKKLYKIISEGNL